MQLTHDLPDYLHTSWSKYIQYEEAAGAQEQERWAQEYWAQECWAQECWAQECWAQECWMWTLRVREEQHR
jgi:hypothetical protein